MLGSVRTTTSFYLVNFKRQENAYYICHAFVEAHTKAQRTAVFFDDRRSTRRRRA